MTHFQPNFRPDFFPQPGRHEGGFFNQGGSENPFADLFRPPQAFHSPFEATGRQPHHHQYDTSGRHAHPHQYGDAASPANPARPGHHHDGATTGNTHHHLPDLSITGDTTHHHKTKTAHRHDTAEPQERRPDTGMGSWGRSSSSGQAIADAARDAVGHHSYLPRPGSQYYGQHLPAALGCTSASTNMFFDGLKAAGKVSDADYRRLHQVGNDAAYVNMQHMGVAKPVDGHDLKPGDWAYFKNPGAKHGHSGVVFEGANGELMVANNHGGTTVATPLSRMMRSYRSVRGLRADI